MNFTELPNEMIQYMFIFLDGFDLIMLSRVCKRLYFLCCKEINKKITIYNNKEFDESYYECKDENENVYYSTSTSLRKYSKGKLIDEYALVIRNYRNYHVLNGELYSSCVSNSQYLLCFYCKLEKFQQNEITHSYGGLLVMDKEKIVIIRRKIETSQTMFRYWNHKTKQHFREIHMSGFYEYLQDDIYMFCPSKTYIGDDFKFKKVNRYAVIYKDKSIILYSKDNLPISHKIIKNYIFFNFFDHCEIYDIINRNTVKTNIELDTDKSKISKYNDKFLIKVRNIVGTYVLGPDGKYLCKLKGLNVETVEKNRYLYVF
jgi:hypothetical protein